MVRLTDLRVLVNGRVGSLPWVITAGHYHSDGIDAPPILIQGDVDCCSLPPAFASTISYSQAAQYCVTDAFTGHVGAFARYVRYVRSFVKAAFEKQRLEIAALRNAERRAGIRASRIRSELDRSKKELGALEREGNEIGETRAPITPSPSCYSLPF